MEINNALEIVLLEEDQTAADELIELSQDSFTRKSSGFDGIDTIIVTFTTISLPLIGGITKVIIELIRAKRYVKIRHGTTEIEGVSETKAIEILERLASDAKKQK